MAVGIVDVVIDFLDQFLDAAKRPPTNGLLRNAVEPDLHLIQPRRIGRSEVYVEPWPGGEPASNSQMLVCGVIIHDDVHLQVLRHVLLNLPEKAQILLMPVARSTFRKHFAVGRVQGGKQCRGSVTPIIMSHSFHITQSQRQHRLGAFQRLNSALLIYAQNHSIFRGIQIQPYNIPYFFYKKWIVRKLEMFLSMRLQAKRLPDAVHGRFRYSRLVGKLTDTPVRCALGFRLQRLAN